jgi:hypothetical protein
MLSIYAGVMGRSVESVKMANRVLLAIALADKYAEGFPMLYGVPVLSFNWMM